MNFKSWGAIPEDIKTKTQWGREGRKIKKDSNGEWHQVYTGGKWKMFNFFTLEDTEEKRRVVKKQNEMLNSTKLNIAKSLYVINKSAKVSRDSKVRNYHDRKHGMVSRCKNRQNELYELKNDVLDVLIKNNIINTVGYHVQTLEHRESIYLVCYELEGFMFHNIISEKEKNNLDYLGDINEVITAEANKIDVSFNQAKELLEYFLINNTIE